MRKYFMKTERISFSNWKNDDLELAVKLWGEEEVTKFICTTGKFTKEDIKERLNIEIYNGEKFNVQYWPIFKNDTGEFIGCCGARPFKNEEESYELGVHIRKEYWRKGYAFEAIQAVMNYCFTKLSAQKLFVGHHPNNISSKNLFKRLNFCYIGDKFYKPTGLYHPSYEIVSNRFRKNEQ